MPTAKDVEDNLSERRTEKSERCGSLGMWRNSRKRMGPERLLHISALVRIDVTGGVKFFKIEKTYSLGFCPKKKRLEVLFSERRKKRGVANYPRDVQTWQACALLWEVSCCGVAWRCGTSGNPSY